MAEVEAETKMGTKFSSKVFLWMLTSSSCRLANKAVVPFTKVSIFYSSEVFFKPIFFMLLSLYYVLAWYTFSHRPDGLHGIVFIKEPIRGEIEICREGHSWTVSSH